MRDGEAMTFLFHRKDRVILTYESEYLSYEIKKLREGCALARKEDVANATMLGARVSQAKLFVPVTTYTKSCRKVL